MLGGGRAVGWTADAGSTESAAAYLEFRRNLPCPRLNSRMIIEIWGWERFSFNQALVKKKAPPPPPRCLGRLKEGGRVQS